MLKTYPKYIPRVKPKRNNAFTLAEVLVILAVIGVVASLTIPGLIKSYEKKQFVTALKKFYVNTNQSLMMASIENGTPGDIYNFFTSDSLAESNIMNTLKYVKDCGYGSEECWAPHKQYYDGSGSDVIISTNARTIITIDGMSIAIEPDNNHCDINYSNSGYGPMSVYCGDIIVDVNGKKSPNIMGRDIFYFHIVNNGGVFLYPWGGMDDKFQDTNRYWKTTGYCNSSKRGERCAGRVMEEGWEITYY